MSSKVRARGSGARAILILFALSSLVAPGARAQEAAEAPAASVWVDVAVKRGGVPEPPGLNFAAAEPLARLPSAAEGAAERLDELQAWNRKGRLPVKIGFSRPLPRARAVEVSARDLRSFGAAPLAGGVLSVEGERAIWVATLEVEGAHSVRARVRVDELPTGTGVWTRGEGGRLHGPYGREQVAEDGSLWLPPVQGARVSVEITVPRSALEAGESLRVRLEELSELVGPRHLLGDNVVAPAAATPCEIDGRCVGTGTLSVIEDYRHAVARLVFDFGGFTALCTGSLVNDTDDHTLIPYLLTANHCISDSVGASSLVAYFDYFSSSCNGPSPPLGSLPQVAGSTLLVTAEVSDVTLLELSSMPAGYNYLLGWAVRPPSEGEMLHMLSHPDGRRQAYSTSAFTSSPNRYCGGFDGLFYAEQVTGSTLGGSSGAPVIANEDGGQILGQLFGACQTTAPDYCDYGDFTELDGEFYVSYQFLQEWLDPPKPEIHVEAIDDRASEPSDRGVFRIYRDGPTDYATEADFVLSGSMVNGVDYQEIVSPVTFPVGRSFVDVPVIPVDDTEPQATLYLRMRLVKNRDHHIRSPWVADVDMFDDDGPDCRSVVVEAQALATGEPSACGRLHAGPDLTIVGGGAVDLYAGTSVVLYDGFTVEPGARLTVSTCGQELCSADPGRPGSSSCHPCVDQVCAADPDCCGVAWGASCVAAVTSICGLTCP